MPDIVRYVFGRRLQNHEGVVALIPGIETNVVQKCLITHHPDKTCCTLSQNDWSIYHYSYMYLHDIKAHLLEFIVLGMWAKTVLCMICVCLLGVEGPWLESLTGHTWQLTGYRDQLLPQVTPLVNFPDTSTLSSIPQSCSFQPLKSIFHW